MAATLINFDDIVDNGGGTILPGSYHGLIWSGFYAMDGSEVFLLFGPQGYTNNVASSPNVAFNGLEGVCGFLGPRFHFISAYFGAAWNNGLNILIRGYRGGNQVAQTTLTVDSLGPPQFNTFNWLVDEVTFVSSGGVDGGYTGSGIHFTMDDLIVDPAPGGNYVGAIGAHSGSGPFVA